MASPLQVGLKGPVLERIQLEQPAVAEQANVFQRSQDGMWSELVEGWAESAVAAQGWVT